MVLTGSRREVESVAVAECRDIDKVIKLVGIIR